MAVTTAVPTSGPMTVPRPPMTSIVTSIDIGVSPIWLVVIDCLNHRYRPPAMPAMNPDRPNATTRVTSGFTPRAAA